VPVKITFNNLKPEIANKLRAGMNVLVDVEVSNEVRSRKSEDENILIKQLQTKSNKQFKQHQTN
jgi:hypothetical protein